MRPAFTLAVLAAASFAPAAMADPSYKLDKIEILGVKSVPVEPLRAGLKTQPGATVTTADLLADQDQLTQELEAAHIAGGVKTSLRNKNNGHIDLIFNVDDQGVQAPKIVTVAPKLKDQLFTGNIKLTADDLTAATGLKPGDELSDARIQAAQAAIIEAYKKANLGVTVGANVSRGELAEITWTLVEQKLVAKKKKKHTDDEGGFSTDAPSSNGN